MFWHAEASSLSDDLFFGISARACTTVAVVSLVYSCSRSIVLPLLVVGFFVPACLFVFREAGLTMILEQTYPNHVDSSYQYSSLYRKCSSSIAVCCNGKDDIQNKEFGQFG